LTESQLPDWFGETISAARTKTELRLAGVAVTGQRGLLGPEIEISKPFAPRRKATFAAGRRAARMVLGQSEPILRASSGEPIWPEGWVGSITHTDQFAMAACAPASQITSIGIDLENIKASILDLGAQIASRQELRQIERYTTDSAAALTLAFSAKEAAYKALYPKHQEFIDYRQALVRITVDSRFELELDPQLNSAVTADRVSGDLWLGPASVLTIARIPKR